LDGRCGVSRMGLGGGGHRNWRSRGLRCWLWFASPDLSDTFGSKELIARSWGRVSSSRGRNKGRASGVPKGRGGGHADDVVGRYGDRGLLVGTDFEARGGAEAGVGGVAVLVIVSLARVRGTTERERENPPGGSVGHRRQPLG
jgi:hypothetical protein